MKSTSHTIRWIHPSLLWLLAALCLLLSGCQIAQPDSYAEVKKGQRGPSDSIKIALATDLHYLSDKLNDNGSCFMNLIHHGDGKASQYCTEIVEAFISQMEQEKPDALILSGDLTFNGEKQSHLDLAEKLSRLKKAGIEVFVLPGNHDLYNSKAASFKDTHYRLSQSIDAREFAQIYAQAGYDQALEKDPASLSYFVRLRPDLSILLVDVNTKEAPGVLTDQSLKWIEARLEQAEKEQSRVIAVSHQNLLVHNPLFSKGFVMENGEKLQRLYEAGPVLCNLSGHMHIQHIQQSDQGLLDIATSSLAVSPFQYAIMQIDSESLDYQCKALSFAHQKEGRKLFQEISRYKMAQGFKKMEEHSEAASSSESENFSDASNVSKPSESTQTDNLAKPEESKEGPVSERVQSQENKKSKESKETAQDNKELSEEEKVLYLTRLNEAYFSGRMDRLKKQAPIYQKLEAENSLGLYVRSILQDGFQNQTRVHQRLKTFQKEQQTD